jgi:single-stranded-DNA-specific exonuclease
VKYTLRAADTDAAREFGRATGLSPMVAQVLLQRGIEGVERATAFVQPKLASLTSPDAMADRTLGADRLASAIRRGERIAVFGDYDVDGVTSAAILSGTLEALGGDVVAFVANRFEGGYGFSDQALARVLQARPAVIVTCDCGSSDHERIAAARVVGVDVIVVDHHLVPDQPLPALAFLNPHRADCGFPYKGLASAGLVFSLSAAVRTALGAKLDLRPWLDLVALGTIGDVAPLDGDNRALVRAGLVRIADGEGCAGVMALSNLGGPKAGRMGAIDVAFRLTPRLNAPGRMGDPTLSLDLLRARDSAVARDLAARVDVINEHRKTTERNVTAAAIDQVRAAYPGELPAVIVAAGDGWHRGVVGITAARLVDTFGVPAIVIGFDGEVGHGSGRSVGGFGLHDLVEPLRPMLSAFGGHQVAVGLSVARHNLDAFRAAVTDSARAHGGGASGHGDAMAVDIVIDGTNTRLPTASDLWQLEPFGEGNPEPRVLLKRAVVDRVREVGTGHLKLNLRVGQERVSAFGFEFASRAPALGQCIDAVGMFRADHWAGQDQVELRLLAFDVAD